MKVYFSHGKESGPWGSKIKKLAEIARQHGCAVDSIDYTDMMDPDLRVERLLRLLESEQGDFALVGSSMGGYVSQVVSQRVNAKGVFLLAPALYIPTYKCQSYEKNASILDIVHGWSDDVIPPEHSIRFAQEVKCSLHLIDGDHRLNSSLDTVSKLFDQFICSILAD
ncbi:YqiA/YcfP family alpha/beta fold hydrolase [Alkalimarinus alittae]|uniref:Alpha/beta hydrolase n=1 Tax=Alkalimarinus alittae TaxID=2961619 RepID=A0ABY6N6X8_9ALTE|nr:YqiA/YcfP family alpha/beta fold hydrolase [Alkalimarinus alittae]UZE97780.1 alpha/beta hydrolase [Alkalimarinus alittae]